jgi:hypothetical protein
MRIDRLLRRSISIIVALCSQKEHTSKERSDTMESNNLDIEALVQEARQERSQAMGKLLAAGWEKCKKLFNTGATGQTIVWRTLPP